ncbi:MULTISPECIES: DUF47 domain-containing protein [Bacillus]|uniref:Phosphate transport regulator n=2 Tax=Bacillus TaxID=1386 RepID=A0A0M4FPH6_9BACI|nr:MULTISPECIES: DUF47 domain-containing protein [Bacillus]ALC80809.1 hypothetical protein AM592_03820 [Bacillus gobiensis]MBP1079729.1 putative phosphate transport protein (TIGR00153 family) [Bacillus capparidis]MED1095125.1 DUF47 domain-containing protein [Bacillus capparidis]
MIKRKKDKFSLLLMEMAKILDETAEYFVNYKVTNLTTLKEFADTLKEYETKGDNQVHIIIKELNQAFITPIEREDILQLTNSLDDVLDGIENFSAQMEIYSITSSDEHIDKFSSNIRECTKEILITMDLLSNNRLKDIREHAIKIKEHEHNCDNLFRKSLKNLFAKETNPIKVIQYKEIYETLEEIADSCQSVANNLETIIMKNA